MIFRAVALEAVWRPFFISLLACAALPVFGQEAARTPDPRLPFPRASEQPTPAPTGTPGSTSLLPEFARPAAERAPSTSAAPTAAEGDTAAGDYVLASSDIIEMTIFREPDLSTRGKIASDGSVQLPLVGELKVAGMTVRQARDYIQKRYDADYLVRPQVYLNVVGYAQRKFTILGQVTKPGTYEFSGGESLTLLQAVGLAGGFTRLADRGKITVERTSSTGTKQNLKINAKRATAEDGSGFEVLPGDVITVGESWF